jgi:hypothetical protein
VPFLIWVNGDEARYLAISQGALFLLVATVIAAAFRPRIDALLSSRRGTATFLVLVFFALLAARWPTFFVRQVPSHDEEQFLAQANIALHFGIPWLAFDPQTEGPLNAYVLALPMAFGAHGDFVTARVMAVLVEFGALAALFAAAALCFGAGIGRLAVIPPLVFWSVSVQDGFVRFTSEQVAIFLSAVTIALLCWAWRREFPPLLAYAAGVVGGTIPFAKLSFMPLDWAILAVAAATLLALGRLPLRARLVRLAALAGGILSFPFLIMQFVAFAGAFRDFWLSYIVTNQAYVSLSNQPLTFLTATDEFGPFFDWLAAVTLAGGLVVALRFRQIPVAVRYAYVAALVLLAGAVDAIYAPHVSAPGYLLVAVIPAAGAAAAGLAAITWVVARDSCAGTRRGLLAVIFVATCLVAQNALLRPHDPWVGPSFEAFLQDAEPDPVSATISRTLRPGARLAIWGYRPQYWVYTSTLMGTRDTTTFWQYTPNFNPNRAYYRRRYVRDFAQNRPEGFLDAGPESFDWEHAGPDTYESLPELSTLVNRDYVLVRRWSGFRFFLRRDLAAERP